MRLLVTSLALAGAQLAACAPPLAMAPAPAAAQVRPIDAGDGGSAQLVLRAVVAGGRGLLAAPRPAQRGDIVHVIVTLTRITGGAAVVATAAIAAADLDVPLRFDNLRSGTTYRVVARAYKSAGTGAPISQDVASTVEVTLDAAYNHPTIAALPLKLDDLGVVEASGAARLDVAFGAVPLRGHVALVAGSFTQNEGAVDGYRGAVRFGNGIAGIACDPASGTVFIADPGKAVVRRMTPQGHVSTFAGTLAATPTFGSADGTAAAATFTFPWALAVGPAGALYVADKTVANLRRIDSGGTVTTVAAGFGAIQGLAADRAGNLYVSEPTCIRKVTPAGVVTTWVGDPGQAGYADGVGGAARGASFGGMAFDAVGHMYVADAGNQVLRRITPAGAVSTWAGVPGASQPIDGPHGTGRFNAPGGVACAADGTLYVADRDLGQIRVVHPDRAIGTLAGSTSGAVDGFGAAARLGAIAGIALGPGGVLWVSDAGTNTIRKVN